MGCFEPMGKSIDPAKLGKTLPSNFSRRTGNDFEPMMLTRSSGSALEHAEVKKLSTVRKFYCGWIVPVRICRNKRFFWVDEFAGVATGSGSRMRIVLSMSAPRWIFRRSFQTFSG